MSLLEPLHEDLAEWRRSSAPSPTAPVFPAAPGGFWRASDSRNWRKRCYKPVAESVGIEGARPYDLRHAFASLLIHEGRKSVVEIAAQLGHNPTVSLDTYMHVMDEQDGGERISCVAAGAALVRWTRAVGVAGYRRPSRPLRRADGGGGARDRAVSDGSAAARRGSVAVPPLARRVRRRCGRDAAAAHLPRA
ncbi:MAG: hypothetical protein M3295_07505 [Chloroflexota bacterium]|nr:hypothetical protein [Chloroflexota bacterium]